MAEGGVWRTIKGRRVFIKDGQSLNEALKESGKFADLGGEPTEEKKKDVKDMTVDELLAEKDRIEKEMYELKGLPAKMKFMEENQDVFEELKKRNAEKNKRLDNTEFLKKVKAEEDKGKVDYKGQDVAIPVKDIKKILKDNDYNLTNNVDEAIFAFPDGSMIDGEFDYGDRGIDHNIIMGIRNADGYQKLHGVEKWAEVHMNTQVVRLVPETKYALIMEGQELTPKQKLIIKKGGYEIEEYVLKPKKK